MSECTCGRIKVGMHVTEARNWSPDCPEHAEMTDAMRATVARSVEWQRRAADARRQAKATVEDDA